MSRTVPRSDWKKLASAARREQDPRKFIYLIKQMYDLINYGEEKEANKQKTQAQSKADSHWARTKLAEQRKRKAA